MPFVKLEPETPHSSCQIIGLDNHCKSNFLSCSHFLSTKKVHFSTWVIKKISALSSKGHTHNKLTSNITGFKRWLTPENNLIAEIYGRITGHPDIIPPWKCISVSGVHPLHMVSSKTIGVLLVDWDTRFFAGSFCMTDSTPETCSTDEICISQITTAHYVW